MLINEKLSLPENWEAVLDMTMLERPVGAKQSRIYICSPCRAGTAHGVIRNMKAARVYMFYTYAYFHGIPKALHAYLPVLLNDNFEDEREIALQFGSRMLKDCDLLFVCGNRISDGMYSEIEEAILLGLDIEVFNKAVFDALVERYKGNGLDLSRVWHEDDNLHHALAMGSDELAAYWGGDEYA